jgi:hypothetical protein
VNTEFDNAVFDYEDYSYTIKNKFESGTTVEMVFWVTETNRLDPILYVEVGLRSYTKRRQRDRPDFDYSVRGKDGLRPAVWATNLLLKFPEHILGDWNFRNKDRVIYTIYWSESRRRGVYHKWLSRHGFYFDQVLGNRCLSKVFPRVK